MSKKWLFGFLGWAFFGPIGALVGFLAGTAFDVFSDSDHPSIGSGGTWSNGNTYSRPAGSTASGDYRTGQRNSFMMSLLVLATAVVKADGKVTSAELENIKGFVRTNFGEQAASEAENIVRQLSAKDINIYQVGAQIKMYMNYSQRSHSPKDGQRFPIEKR